MATTLDDSFTATTETSSAQRMSHGAVHSGFVQKESKTSLQRMMPCLDRTTLKSRYLILKGNYVFRYQSSTSNTPKGAPIALGSTTSIMADEDLNPIEASDVEHQSNQNVARYAFLLNTIRKNYRFVCVTEEDRDNWVFVLERAKERAIRASLGHANLSAEDRAANRLGGELVRQSLRKEAASDNATETLNMALQ